jgi:hypothetical protein
MGSTPAGHQGHNKPLHIVWRDQADHAIYEEARTKRLFNAQLSARYPIAVVFVRSPVDIGSAIQLASEKNCRISVRAGGHSYAGWSVRDEAVLLDLGGLSRNLVLHDKTGIVSVSPQITGQELASYLSEKDRFFSVGHCPDVGLGGFLLGGGMGWNCNVRLVHVAFQASFKYSHGKYADRTNPRIGAGHASRLRQLMSLQLMVQLFVLMFSKTATFFGRQEVPGRHSRALYRVFIFKLERLPNACFRPDTFTR